MPPSRQVRHAPAAAIQTHPPLRPRISRSIDHSPHFLSAALPQWTQTADPRGMRLPAQIQSMAASVTRTQPWDAGYAGTEW